MLVLPAELTHVQAPACLNMLLTAVRADKGRRVLVDATPLTRFDSSALAVLLECRRECLQDDRRFAVRGLAPRLRELAGLYGIAALLPEPDDALAPAAAPA
ncbi:MAG: STAS domain-containing protein [Pseudomonadota bacterium]|nr:STAS domain-containing protein [Pseudomonadota bacterium]